MRIEQTEERYSIPDLVISSFCLQPVEHNFVEFSQLSGKTLEMITQLHIAEAS